LWGGRDGEQTTNKKVSRAVSPETEGKSRKGAGEVKALGDEGQSVRIGNKTHSRLVVGQERPLNVKKGGETES